MYTKKTIINYFNLSYTHYTELDYLRQLPTILQAYPVLLRVCYAFWSGAKSSRHGIIAENINQYLKFIFTLTKSYFIISIVFCKPVLSINDRVTLLCILNVVSPVCPWSFLILEWKYCMICYKIVNRRTCVDWRKQYQSRNHLNHFF